MPHCLATFYYPINNKRPVPEPSMKPIVPCALFALCTPGIYTGCRVCHHNEQKYREHLLLYHGFMVTGNPCPRQSLAVTRIPGCVRCRIFLSFKPVRHS